MPSAYSRLYRIRLGFSACTVLNVAGLSSLTSMPPERSVFTETAVPGLSALR